MEVAYLNPLVHAPPISLSSIYVLFSLAQHPPACNRPPESDLSHPKATCRTDFTLKGWKILYTPIRMYLYYQIATSHFVVIHRFSVPAHLHYTDTCSPDPELLGTSLALIRFVQIPVLTLFMVAPSEIQSTSLFVTSQTGFHFSRSLDFFGVTNTIV